MPNLLGDLDVNERRAERRPSHVVVDTRGGYVFSNDASGQPFDGTRARAFARERNAGMKPEHRTYEVYALVHCPAPPYATT